MPIAIPDLPPAVLCFAAGDATSGGGLASDALTLASMGCHPLTVQTAALLRDTRSVDEVWPIDAEVVVSQARAVLEDIPVSAFKLGFCGSVENIAVIAEVLSDYPELPLVVEPALYAGGHWSEADDEIAAALAELILPQTTLLVAGRHEICRLAGVSAVEVEMVEDGDEDEDEDDGESGDEPGIDEALARLLAAGTEYILLTGGGEHGPQIVNTLVGHEGVVRTDAWPRLPGRFLGAGATLAAAAAAALAHDMALPEAVREAQEFTQQALRHAYRPGMGRALPDRFFWARGKEDGDV